MTTKLHRRDFAESWGRMTESQRRDALLSASYRPKNVDPSPLALGQRLDPLFVETPALRLINGYLLQVRDAIDVMYQRRRRYAQLVRQGVTDEFAIEQVQDEIPDVGITRLIISMPPQEGKTSLTSQYNIEWLLQQFPSLRFALVSYGDANAGRISYLIRADIETFNGREGIDLGLRLAADEKAKSRWTLNTGGGVYAIGVGGGLSGRPVDCLAGASIVNTELGYYSIRDLCQTTNPPRVLSFNHETGLSEYRRVIAAREIDDRQLYEVTTTGGRSVTCTADHRFATSEGYKSASLLRPGDTLIVGWSESPACVRPVRQGQKEQEPNVSGLLRRGATAETSHAGLFLVRRGVPSRSSRARQEGEAGPNELLLLTDLRRRLAAGVGEAVSSVRSAYGFKRPRTALLLCRMSGAVPTGEEAQVVSNVSHRLRVFQHEAGLLHEGVRRPIALAEDDGPGQFQLQDRRELRAVVPDDAPANTGTRRSRLPGLRSRRSAGGAPPQRSPVGQPARESDLPLRGVPYGSPQVEADTVLMVRELRGQRDTVYDIQVEGNCNFFANEVLVHNCMVVDDPVKDNRDADSHLKSENAWAWWMTVGRPRLSPWAPVIVVTTRWDDADLPGRLQSKQIEDAKSGAHYYDRWTVVNIPAEADHDPSRGEVDVLGREPGEFMVSARGRSRSDWLAIKNSNSTSPRFWNALYQGRPSPATGTIFQREWFRYYDSSIWQQESDGSFKVPGYELWQSWDFTFRDTSGTDFVVGQLWATKGPNAYLVTQVRARLSFTNSLDAMRRLTRLFPQSRGKYVEGKANGDAIVDVLKKELTGIIVVNPTTSKEIRAEAVSPFVRAGNVWLPSKDVALAHPEIAFSVPDFVAEFLAFPNAAHDDQVDAATQFLRERFLKGGDGSFTSPRGRIPTGTMSTSQPKRLSPVQARLARQARGN